MTPHCPLGILDANTLEELARVIRGDEHLYYRKGYEIARFLEHAGWQRVPEYHGEYRREWALARLCIRTSVTRFRNAVEAADGLVDADGKVRADQSDLSSHCTWDEKPQRAKCEVLEQLGRGWHQIEDFYSHSNWTDRAAPGPIGLENPPGLGRTEVAPFLDMGRYSGMKDADWTRDARTLIPVGLTTGCYTDVDSTGVKPADCDGRVSHNRALNKDTAASARSKPDDNFRHATAGATAEITRQWNDFKADLLKTYPDHGRGAQMICALVHDDPAGACP
ncbi:hypothetical protein STANM337S_05979 [Streptomyces tanashiensis]